jgi:hypothetical protein
VVQQIYLIEFWNLLAVSGIFGLLLDRIVSGTLNQNTGFAPIKFLHIFHPGIQWITGHSRETSAAASSSPMNSGVFLHELKLFFQRTPLYQCTNVRHHEKASGYQSDFCQKSYLPLKY